ncbi:hypothetical protein T4C_3830 [Trichinella pseudospiralis]|uniref:Uncharacterized protein n=1 Tax=Trichinella pseudospiralis TaxID=6337 RepID=A0A0V1JXT3_TRIPS|nr:hypothetical protein T4C_3830 [Trichinella pseudospiralis]
MTLGGSTHLIHPRRIGHSDPPKTCDGNSYVNNWQKDRASLPFLFWSNDLLWIGAETTPFHHYVNCEFS